MALLHLPASQPAASVGPGLVVGELGQLLVGEDFGFHEVLLHAARGGRRWLFGRVTAG